MFDRARWISKNTVSRVTLATGLSIFSFAQADFFSQNPNANPNQNYQNSSNSQYNSGYSTQNNEYPSSGYVSNNPYQRGYYADNDTDNKGNQNQNQNQNRGNSSGGESSYSTNFQTQKSGKYTSSGRYIADDSKDTPSDTDSMSTSGNKMNDSNKSSMKNSSKNQGSNDYLSQNEDRASIDAKSNGSGMNQNANDRISDQELLKKIRNKISSGWFSKGYDEVDVKVTNGNVTLGGTVNTMDDRKKVEKDVREISGVRSVNNQVTVQSPMPSGKNEMKSSASKED